jgi:hypothetical protein
MFTTAGVPLRAMALKSGPPTEAAATAAAAGAVAGSAARVGGSRCPASRTPTATPTASDTTTAMARRARVLTRPASRGRGPSRAARKRGSSRRRRPSRKFAVTLSGSTSSVSWKMRVKTP